MNQRNLDYIRRFNSPRAIKIADDKLLSKKILSKANIPNPKLLGYISNYKELQEFDWNKLPNSFVIKPVSGLEGGGIEIFYNRDRQGNWIKADGSRVSQTNLEDLAADILDGKYSLHNQPDKVFFEERVRMHKAFQYYAYKGAPDIRIIVFNSIPIMGMVRLPTKESNGKGNLAMGAVGAGIDMTSGVTTTAVIGKSEHISYMPGTKLNVSGLKIPYWNKILHNAVAAQLVTKLKFAAVDFLIDNVQGPLIVELNARPGLSIQLANQEGLKIRLRKARGLKVQSIEKGIRLAKDLFGGDIEEDIERISGKSLIGIYENIIIYPKTSSVNSKLVEIKTKAKIDTGADSTSIDEGLAIKLGYEEELIQFQQLKKELNIAAEFTNTKEIVDAATKLDAKLQELANPFIICSTPIRSSHGRSLRLSILINLKLGDYTFETKATVFDRSQLEYQIIVGRKSLSKFLIEPSRT